MLSIYVLLTVLLYRIPFHNTNQFAYHFSSTYFLSHDSTYGRIPAAQMRQILRLCHIYCHESCFITDEKGPQDTDTLNTDNEKYVAAAWTDESRKLDNMQLLLYRYGATSRKSVTGEREESKRTNWGANTK